MAALETATGADSFVLTRIDQALRGAPALGDFERAAYFTARASAPGEEGRAALRDAEAAFERAWQTPPEHLGLHGGLGGFGVLAQALAALGARGVFPKLAAEVAEVALIDLEGADEDAPVPLSLAQGLAGLGLFAARATEAPAGRLLLDSVLARLAAAADLAEACPWRVDGQPLPSGLFAGELGLLACLSAAAPHDGTGRAARLRDATAASLSRRAVDLAGARGFLEPSGEPAAPGLATGALGWFGATRSDGGDDARADLFLMTAGREWALVPEEDLSLATGSAGFAIASLAERPGDRITADALADQLAERLAWAEERGPYGFFDGLAGAAATLHTLRVGRVGPWLPLLGYGFTGGEPGPGSSRGSSVTSA